MLRWLEVVGGLGQEGLSALVGQPYLARCDETYRNNITIGERVSSFPSSPSFLIETLIQMMKPTRLEKEGMRWGKSVLRGSEKSGSQGSLGCR